MKKFAATLINAEIRFARKVEAAGLASYSQAVKAIERQEEEKLEAWRQDLERQAQYRRELGVR